MWYNEIGVYMLNIKTPILGSVVNNTIRRASVIVYNLLHLVEL